MTDLDLSDIQVKSGSAVSVALTSGGYPNEYETGETVHGLNKEWEGVRIFHSGTREREDGNIVTAGGRVLFVTAVEEDINEARENVYRAIEEGGVNFANMHYRSDIGRQY